MTRPWLDEDSATTGIVDALRTAMDPIPVGDGKRPDGIDEEATYLVVNKIATGRAIGGRSDPEALKWVKYQLTAIGQQRDASGQCLNRAMRFVLELDDSGAFVNEIPCSGAQICGRRTSLTLSGAESDYTTLAQVDFLVCPAAP